MTVTEERELAAWREGERERIAALPDPELAAYLGECAGNVGHPVYGPACLAAYRDAWHEAVTVRGARGVPWI